MLTQVGSLLQMEIQKVNEIEEWFDDEQWKTEKQLESEETKHPNKFFRTYIPTFWSYLSLVDIIILASTNKMAAYTAYGDNIKGFRDFCRRTWKNRCLDLTRLPQLTSERTRHILNLFNKKEIIFPPNIPNDTLDHLPCLAKIFTFNLSTITRLHRPRYRTENALALKIIGNGCIDISDATIDLLFTFPYIQHLWLEDVYLTKVSIAALRTMEIRHLTLQGCMISSCDGIEFVRALENSKRKLESFVKDTRDPYTWQKTIYHLNSRIYIFHKICFYKIPVNLDFFSPESLSLLERSQSLRQLHIINITHERHQNSEQSNRRNFKLRNARTTIEHVLSP